MEHPATEVARALADRAEHVCRRYLSNGRREGNYWLVGDIADTPGRSLYVRLRTTPDGHGRAGKWTDAESGEHGDLLDIIRLATPGGSLGEALAEARDLLSLPSAPLAGSRDQVPLRKSPDASRRLIAMARPIGGTTAERYLAARGIVAISDLPLRFHPRCWYRRSRDDRGSVPAAMPALIAIVTDLSGRITGAHRTWLATDGSTKAPVATPRRAMGNLLGHGVRFGLAGPVMAFGEGLETMLSLRAAAPELPAIAALSAAHLGAIRFPPDLRRLYVARESDPAGCKAYARLRRRTDRAGIELLPLDSRFADLNADLLVSGLAGLRRDLIRQMHPEDACLLV